MRLLAPIVVLASGSAHALSPGPPIASRHHRVLVAVGVNSFAHPLDDDAPRLDAGWKPLRYAEKDARDFGRALSAYGFVPFEGRSLTGTTATAREIRDTLERLVDETARRPQDSYEIVVYFSSHGFALEAEGRRESFLVAHDTPGTAKYGTSSVGLDVAAREAIAEEDLLRLFVGRLGRNVHRTALIYDACHVAGGKSPNPGAKGETAADSAAAAARQRALVERLRALDRTTLVLSAVSWGETAAESRRFENAIYTRFLVEALEGGADLVGGQAVLPGLPMSLFAAHQWARGRVAEVRGGLQSPSWASPSLNTGMFFLDRGALSKTAAAPPVLVLESALGMKVYAIAREVLGLKGADEASAEPVPIPDSGLVLPGPGEYRVRVVDAATGRAELEADVELSAGEVRSLNVHRGLAARPHHGLSLAAGYRAPAADLWGASTGVLGHPTLDLRYGLDGFPGPDAQLALSAELGWTDRVAGGLGIEQATVFAGVEYLHFVSLGLLRLGVGPRLGGGLFARTVEGTREREMAAATGVGLVTRMTLPLAARLAVGLGLDAQIISVGRIDQAFLSVGASLGLSLRTPSAIAVGDAL